MDYLLVVLLAITGPAKARREERRTQILALEKPCFVLAYLRRNSIEGPAASDDAGILAAS
jgi:hypothetical protein